MKMYLLALVMVFQFYSSAQAKEAIEISIGSNAVAQLADANALRIGEYYCAYQSGWELRYLPGPNGVWSLVAGYKSLHECLEAAKKANESLGQ